MANEKQQVSIRGLGSAPISLSWYQWCRQRWETLQTGLSLLQSGGIYFRWKGRETNCVHESKKL